MVIDRNKKRSPPYVSYRSFLTLLEDLQHEGLPSRIDRSYWGDKFSGSTGTQLMSALRFLNLIDSHGVPTSHLRELVTARGDTKCEVFKRIYQDSFSFITQCSLDTGNATYAQLEEVFNDFYQVDRDVARKCIKFFTELAGDAGVPLSPFITKKSKNTRISQVTEKVPKRNGTRTGQNLKVPQNKGVVPQPLSWKELLLSKFPSFDPTWSPDVQVKWFEAFDELLKRGFISSNE
ncbi:MAG: DUF5343 domain-containing protein [Dehalococcoidales bacterium]|nr:DUF5343 domain-containing protein [Dehalococcoidales bacterium]